MLLGSDIHVYQNLDKSGIVKLHGLKLNSNYNLYLFFTVLYEVIVKLVYFDAKKDNLGIAFEDLENYDTETNCNCNFLEYE